MKRRFPILAALLFATAGVAACGGDRKGAGPTEPVVYLPAVPERPGVGYFELPVRTEQRALISVSSPRIGRIEMHETVSSGSRTAMRPIPRLPVGEDGRIVFESGGRHLMLFDLDPALRPGEQVTLTFTFERGPARTMSASVRAAGDERR